MKKFFASALVVLSMVAFVACSSKSSEPAVPSNPGIAAAEDFLKNPTEENSEKVEAAMEKMNEEEMEEFMKWCIDHADEIEAAEAKL